MAEKDKEFGEWQETCMINGKLSIKRFKKGLVIKEKGSLTEQLGNEKKTTKRNDISCHAFSPLGYSISIFTPPPISGEAELRFISRTLFSFSFVNISLRKR